MTTNSLNPNNKKKYQRLTVDMLSNSDYILYRKEGRQGHRLTIKILLYLIFFIFLLGISIYFRSIQIELNSEYESLSSQLNLITSENVRLQVKMESELSNDAIEELARDIGMEELSSSNIEYITFNPSAKAEVLSGGNIFEKVIDWCETIVLKFQL